MAKRAITANRPNKDVYDVIIVGGGPGGGTLAALLGTNGIRVACIDRDAPVSHLSEDFDGRTTAISWGSQKILDRAGIWRPVAARACPINRIDILDGHSPVLLEFSSREVSNEPFGWILENRDIRKSLFARLASLSSVDHIAPATVIGIDRDSDNIMRVMLSDNRVLTAPLVVGADGRTSFVRDWAGIGTRSWSYRQRAVICTVEHEKPHHHVAVEHFRSQGPFAILPLNDGQNGAHRSSVVWTEHGPLSHSAMHYGPESFDAGLNSRFPEMYGRVRLIGKRACYPLGLQHAYAYTAPGIALIADAAHAIHPIAGQGLNLGFRDIDTLSDLICNAMRSDLTAGHESVLDAYAGKRRLDNMAMAGATDLLNRLFSNGMPGMSPLRQAGLRIVSSLPPAKKFFMHQAMGRKASR